MKGGILSLMTSNSLFSTTTPPRRRRERPHVSEALPLDAVDLAPFVREPEGEPVRLVWPDTQIELTFQRDGDQLLVLDGPAPTTIELAKVTIAHGRSWRLFVCGSCGVRRRRLYLPWDEGDWACKKCHRLVTRHRRRPEALQYLHREWQRLGHEIERVRRVQHLGDRPVVVRRDDPDVDGPTARDLMRDVAAVRKVLGRLAPPGFLEGTT